MEGKHWYLTGRCPGCSETSYNAQLGPTVKNSGPSIGELRLSHWLLKAAGPANRYSHLLVRRAPLPS